MARKTTPRSKAKPRAPKYQAGQLGIGVSPESPPLDETVGVGGASVFGGYPSSDELNREMASPKFRYRRFRELFYNVDIVGAGVTAFLRLGSGVDWTVAPPKKKAGQGGAEADQLAELTNEILHDMDMPWSRAVRKQMIFPFQGNAVAAWQAKLRDDGVYGLHSVNDRPSSTIDQWDIDPATGDLRGVVQRSPADGFVAHYIERYRMVYNVHDLMTSQPDGVGMFRHIVNPAKFLEAYLKLEGEGFQTDLRGIPKAFAPYQALDEQIGKAKPGSKGKTFTKRDKEDAVDGIETITANHIRHKKMGIVLDSQVFKTKEGDPTGSKMWDFELIRGDAGPWSEIGVAIERITRSIARILGVEHMLLGGDGAGSLALGREKILMFKLLVDSTLTDMAWQYRHDLISRLWDMNGWDPALMPTLVPSATALRDVREALDIVTGLAQAGRPLRKGDKAPDAIRALVNLPPEPPEIDDNASLLGNVNDDPTMPDNPADPMEPTDAPPPAMPPGASADAQAAADQRTEGVDVAAKLIAKAAGDGVMVALYLPKDASHAISLVGGADRDSHHVTLAYLGKGLDENMVKAILETVRGVAAGWSPLSGKLAGVGRFSASETSDGQDVIYASVDVPGLEDFRTEIVNELDAIGAKASRIHGYTPHVTLSYIGVQDDSPIKRLDHTPVTFDEVVVSAGAERFAAPFGGKLSKFRRKSTPTLAASGDELGVGASVKIGVFLTGDRGNSAMPEQGWIPVVEPIKPDGGSGGG